MTVMSRARWRMLPEGATSDAVVLPRTRAVRAFGYGFVSVLLPLHLTTLGLGNAALWLFQMFDLSVATTGTIFFCTGLLAAFSQLAAPRVAARIGLVRTGLHPYPGQPLPHVDPLHAHATTGDRDAAAAQRGRLDGSASPHLVGHGRGDASGTPGGRQPDQRPPLAGIGSGAVAVRLAPRPDLDGRC